MDLKPGFGLDLVARGGKRFRDDLVRMVEEVEERKLSRIADSEPQPPLDMDAVAADERTESKLEMSRNLHVAIAPPRRLNGLGVLEFDGARPKVLSALEVCALCPNEHLRDLEEARPLRLDDIGKVVLDEFGKCFLAHLLLVVLQPAGPFRGDDHFQFDEMLAPSRVSLGIVV